MDNTTHKFTLRTQVQIYQHQYNTLHTFSFGNFKGYVMCIFCNKIRASLQTSKAGTHHPERELYLPTVQLA